MEPRRPYRHEGIVTMESSGQTPNPNSARRGRRLKIALAALGLTAALAGGMATASADTAEVHEPTEWNSPGGHGGGYSSFGVRW